MTGKAKPRKPTRLAERARELRTMGKSRDDVARELGVSTGWVSKAWAAPQRRAALPPSQGDRAPVAAPLATPATAAATGQAGAETATGDESPEELRALLRRQTEALERMQDAAEGEGDFTAFTQIARAVSANTALIAKLTPRPPPSLEDSPDMREAARSAREKLHELLDRALGGGAT